MQALPFSPASSHAPPPDRRASAWRWPPVPSPPSSSGRCDSTDGVSLVRDSALRVGVGRLALEFQGNERLVAHDPCVVPWIEAVAVTRPEVSLRAVVGSDVERS